MFFPFYPCLMSILEKKSDACLWIWIDPLCPLGVLRDKWIEGEILTREELAEIEDNRSRNPDSRIRKSTGTLLDAIAGQPAGHAAHLMEEKNFRRVKKLIRHIGPRD